MRPSIRVAERSLRTLRSSNFSKAGRFSQRLNGENSTTLSSKHEIDSGLNKPQDFHDDAGPVSEVELDSILKDLFRPAQIKQTDPKLDALSRTLQRNLEINSPTQDVLQALKERLGDPSNDAGSLKDAQKLGHNLSDRLLAKLRPVVNSTETQKTQVMKDSDYLHVFSRLEDAVQKTEQSLASSSTSPTATIPLGVATLHEWTTLFHQTLIAGDRKTAESVIALMKRSGVTIDEALHDTLLAAYVAARDADGATQYLERQKQAGVLPTKVQQHLHVQVFLKARRIQEARSIIFRYEEENIAPAQETYVLLIKSLLSVSHPSVAASNRAAAWDTFAHMRYVAHPNPSADMYSTMISACADASVPQPQRALDLFTEMAVDHRIAPTRDAYNAVIRACARGRDKSFAYEAFRLAKELVETHNSLEARTNEEQRMKDDLRPNLDTFSALLETTMRTGDLARARWILAEMIRAGERLNDTIMGHVFHTYATYTPPMKRAFIKDSKKVDIDLAQDGDDAIPESHPSEKMGVPVGVGVIPDDDAIPQTKEGILQEVNALFWRIKNGRAFSEQSPGLSPDANPDLAFSGVEITTNLLNSFLAVHYRHSTISESIRIYNEVFPQFNVDRNSRTYADALAALAISKSGKSAVKIKHKSRELAEPIWASWTGWRDSLPAQNSENTSSHGFISPRRIEQMYSNMIKIRIGDGNCKGALDLVKDFVKHYPPSAIYPKGTNQAGTESPLRTESRIALEAKQRPLIRLTTDLEISDLAIPPFLTFTDVSPIHQMLTTQGAGTKDEKAYLAWVSNAYAGHLKQRKLWVTLGKEVKKDVKEAGLVEGEPSR